MPRIRPFTKSFEGLVGTTRHAEWHSPYNPRGPHPGPFDVSYHARPRIRPQSKSLDYCILHSDGKVEPVSGPLKKADVCAQFGLNPRDLRVLDGDAPSAFAPTILVRPKSIVYASSVLRAIITPWALHIFAASKKDDGRLSTSLAIGPVHVGFNSITEANETAELLRTTLGEFNNGGSFYNHQLPFELRALEAVLYRITGGYRRALNTLQKQTEELLESLQDDQSSENSMHEAIRDVADTRHCVDDFLLRAKGLQTVLAAVVREDDTDLANMYLSASLIDKKPRQTNDHAEAELLIEGILRRQDETVVTCEGLVSQITNAERALELGLDATRNSLIFLEIKIDVIILGLSAMTAICGTFGMNLTSHFEDHPHAFYYVLGGTTCLGLFIIRAGLRGLSRAKRTRMSLMGRNTHQCLPVTRAADVHNL